MIPKAERYRNVVYIHSQTVFSVSILCVCLNNLRKMSRNSKSPPDRGVSDHYYLELLQWKMSHFRKQRFSNSFINLESRLIHSLQNTNISLPGKIQVTFQSKLPDTFRKSYYANLNDLFRLVFF